MQIAHNVRKLTRGELAASTSPVTELGESMGNRFGHLHSSMLICVRYRQAPNYRDSDGTKRLG